MLLDDKKIGVQAILEQLEEIFIFWLGGGGGREDDIKLKKWKVKKQGKPTSTEPLQIAKYK